MHYINYEASGNILMNANQKTLNKTSSYLFILTKERIENEEVYYKHFNDLPLKFGKNTHAMIGVASTVPPKDHGAFSFLLGATPLPSLTADVCKL